MLPLAVLYSMTMVGSIGGGWLPTYFLNRGADIYQGRMRAMLIIALCPLVVLLAQPLGYLGFWVPVILIGIGASAQCDGQVLVVDDMLGLFTAFKPKFAKRYATLGEDGEKAIAKYAQEVRDRSFPAPEHVFADEVKKK